MWVRPPSVHYVAMHCSAVPAQLYSIISGDNGDVRRTSARAHIGGGGAQPHLAQPCLVWPCQHDCVPQFAGIWRKKRWNENSTINTAVVKDYFAISRLDDWWMVALGATVYVAWFSNQYCLVHPLTLPTPSPYYPPHTSHHLEYFSSPLPTWTVLS